MNHLLSATVRTFVTAATLAVAGTAALAQGATGDVQAGKQKAEMCIGCHGIPGYQNSFPEIHKVPKISGQSDKYIVASLTAYKKGDRKHPTMRAIAASLTEQDIGDLAAFYEQLGGPAAAAPPDDAPPASPEVAALLTKGACSSCHGVNFSKPIDGAYPKLAGQHADYLFVALRSYAAEGTPQVGRANPIMGAQVKAFSRAELKSMADYLASLPGELRTVPQSKFR